MSTAPPGGGAPGSTPAPPVTTGTCPRCAAELALAPDGTGLRCAGCRGVFAFRAAVEAVLAEATALGGATSYRASARASQGPESGKGQGAWEPTFRYLRCPVCSQPMNRQNFLKRSGVIVDHCLHHGTWFDADEAARASAYVAQAGATAAEDEARPSRRQGAELSRGARLVALLTGA